MRDEESLHCGGIGQARAVHGAARPGPGLRGDRRVPGTERRQARRVQGTHHRRARARPTTPRSSSRRWPGATGCSPCWCPGAPATTRPARPRPCSTTPSPGARLIFSCGWHITRDGKDVYPDSLKREERIARLLTAGDPRAVDIDDQVEACRRIFASDTRWTVVRGSDLEEGESQGLPVWSRHVGDPILASNMHPPRGLCPVHGGRPGERRAGPRGAGHRRLPDGLGAGCRAEVRP